MGLRGPAPTPTVLKRLAGFPGKRAINHAEPQPPTLMNLDPPKWLDRDTRAMWRRLVPRIASTPGLVTEADTLALEMLCELAVDIRELRASGEDLKALRDNRGLMKQLIAEFGLTPSSRTRLKVEPVKPSDPGDEFLPTN